MESVFSAAQGFEFGVRFELLGAPTEDFLGGGCPTSHTECDRDSIIHARLRKPDDVFRAALLGSARGLEALGSRSHRENESVWPCGGHKM